jgi:inosine-uridine nucleoside N-ribohydrolase
VSIPVILDTDIGFDVDDVWALAFLLRCPELDIKLIVTDTGDTHYSAQIVAKLLQVAGRTDIPVGIGIPLDETQRTHEAWLDDFNMDDYSGEVLLDGVGAICDTVQRSAEKVSIICIGPVPNIAAALAREPDIVKNSRFIGMHGSIRRGYMGANKPMKEYNVKKHTLACQRVFATPWDITITPLDTCGTVFLKGENFDKVKTSDAPLARAVMENHFVWCEKVKDWPILSEMDPQIQSSLLYDTVAVYLAFSESLLEMEQLSIIVTDDGKTMVDNSGQMVNCAMNWKDQDAFEQLLTERLVDQAMQTS